MGRMEKERREDDGDVEKKDRVPISLTMTEELYI